MKLNPLKLLVTAVLVLCLTACVSPVAGLKAFFNPSAGYRFLYPNGWVQVQLSRTGNAPDVVFRDLINETENVSVVISPLENAAASLESLGTPGEVGYLLQQKAIAPPNSNRRAELVNAESRLAGDKTYYVLEYEVTLPDQKRHDLATVVVNRGNLYTFNVSTTEARWPRVAKQFQTMVNSFEVEA
jgi:photosystem II oxygen-evolving enhancer protein 2